MYLACFAAGISTKTFLPSKGQHFKHRKPGKTITKLGTSLFAATTMADFETQLAVMYDRFPAASMRYLETTWLVYKERFVTAFLRNKHHYGHLTTSRVESAHASL